MELCEPIELKTRLQTCKTGTTVFCRSKGVEAATIRLVLKSPWNHTAVVFWINGELFIVEAMIGDVIRPKRFDLWWADRMGDEFGISECAVFDYVITDFFGARPTRYDIMSVMVYMLIYQLTGWWLGRVNERASKRLFCFEFSALIRGLPLWWRIVPEEFPDDEVLNKD